MASFPTREILAPTHSRTMEAAGCASLRTRRSRNRSATCRSTGTAMCSSWVAGLPGTCAAVAAARQGADVVLLERYGHLGGLSTGGLVFWIDRMADWEGNLVVAGLGKELMDRCGPEATPGTSRGAVGLARPGAGGVLGAAHQRSAGRRAVVADYRPGVAEAVLQRHGARVGRDDDLPLLGRRRRPRRQRA